MRRNTDEPGTGDCIQGLRSSPGPGFGRGCSRLLLAALLGLLRPQALRKDGKEKGKLVRREEVHEMDSGENSSSVPHQERSLYQRGR